MEQNRKPRNKTTQTNCSLTKVARMHTGERIVFSTNIVGNLKIYLQDNEIGPLYPT